MASRTQARRKNRAQTIPTQCRVKSERLTTRPARARVGSTEKRIGASTMAKKKMEPSQRVRESNRMKRRKVKVVPPKEERDATAARERCPPLRAGSARSARRA